MPKKYPKSTTWSFFKTVSITNGSFYLKKKSYESYMQRQYDPQKAELKHKAQMCAKYHKWLWNNFYTLFQNEKLDINTRMTPAHQMVIVVTPYDSLLRVKNNIVFSYLDFRAL